MFSLVSLCMEDCFPVCGVLSGMLRLSPSTLSVVCVCSRPKNADDALYELPEHINVQTSCKKTEDMLSNQMLSGIPEVDLGIE